MKKYIFVCLLSLQVFLNPAHSAEVGSTKNYTCTSAGRMGDVHTATITIEQRWTTNIISKFVMNGQQYNVARCITDNRGASRPNFVFTCVTSGSFLFFYSCK